LVEFVYEPWKRIVIHEIVKYSFDTLVHLQCLGVQSGQLSPPLFWADGLAFKHVSMPPTEDVIKAQIKGKIHWSQLAFAFLPEYKQGVTLPQGNVTVPILDLTNNNLFIDLAAWIKTKHSSIE
jgi:hypothetical protein